jgi:hypothetical protein
MAAQITIYNLITPAEVPVYSRVATTTNAFKAINHKELMREWTLDFFVTNLDSSRQYIAPSTQNILLANGRLWLVPQTQFQIANGQLFDITQFNQNSGADNTTEACGNHVSYRLNNYSLPAGYSFVGTVAALIQDMLIQSGANVAFTVGTCASVSGSFSPGNTQPLNLRAALFQLVALGVEIDFDNFQINAPVRIGSVTGKVFQFARDLISLKRQWNGTATPPTFTYDITAAVLMRLPGGSPSDNFIVGDTVGIADKVIGDQITGKRICTYDECLDNPTQDLVAIGQFLPDDASTVQAMQVDISTSVQQGDQYSNVSIDHTNGFMAINTARTLAVRMNATDCFSIYSGDGNNNWTLMSKLDVNGLQAGTLTMPGYPNFKVIVGKGPNPGDGLGLFIVDTNISATPFLKFWLDSGGNTIIQKTQGDLIFEDENGNGIGTNGTSSPLASFTVKEGLITGWSYPIPSGASGNLPFTKAGGDSSVSSSISDIAVSTNDTAQIQDIPSSEVSSEAPVASQAASSSSEASSSKPSINGTINSDGLIVQASTTAPNLLLPDPKYSSPNGNAYPDTKAGN